MIRTTILLALAVLLVGCTRQQSRTGLSQSKKELPPPYGASPPGSIPPKPVSNLSPLGMASADPARMSPDEPVLIPPKARGVVPSDPTDPPTDAAFPPFKRRPEPRPDSLPSPFAPNGNSMPATGGTAMQPAAKGLAQLKDLLAVSGAAWKVTDTYEATLTRREINPKGQLNNEVLIFQFRRDPMSVYTRNIDGGGKGREVLYNPGKHGDKMYVKLGEGDSKLVKPGFIAPPISPDDPKVKEKARYSIRDAGFGRTLSTIGAVVAKIEAGQAPADSLVFHGEVKRDEYAYPLVGITHKLRRGDDPLMPAGGARYYFFDLKKGSPSYGMPVLVIANDASDKEVEYYLFAKVHSPARLTDADFNPARLEKK